MIILVILSFIYH